MPSLDWLTVFKTLSDVMECLRERRDKNTLDKIGDSLLVHLAIGDDIVRAGARIVQLLQQLQVGDNESETLRHEFLAQLTRIANFLIQSMKIFDVLRLLHADVPQIPQGSLASKATRVRSRLDEFLDAEQNLNPGNDIPFDLDILGTQEELDEIRSYVDLVRKTLNENFSFSEIVIGEANKATFFL